MANIPIIIYLYIAIVFAIAGFLSFVCAVYYSIKLSKYITDETSNENVDIICVHVNKTQQQYTNAMFLFKLFALTFFLVALIVMSVFSYWNSTAKKYGAYDDYIKTETISSIKENTSVGFIDQSADLPESMDGCTIIFFKYGCNDCARIYKSLNEYLNEKDIADLYFVSTRSDRGMELIETYDIPAVPAVAYNIISSLDNTPMAGTKFTWNVIYDIDALAIDTDIFVPENFDAILDVRDADLELVELKKEQ